jgi:hypothetical protein
MNKNKKPPAPKAESAIRRLTPVAEKLGPRYAAFFVLPNVVLTLAGARTYADGVFYHPESIKQAEIWRDEIAKGLRVLQEAEPMAVRVSIKPSLGQQMVSYDMLLQQNIESIFGNYSWMDAIDRSIVLRAQFDFKLFDRLTAVIAGKDLGKGFDPPARRSDEVNSHVMTGMLLGYPQPAIQDALTTDRSGPFAPVLVDADIRGAAYYRCPQPVYQYGRGLVKNPLINAHEKLWSGILEDFYSSSFHKNLAADPEFAAQIEAITKH